MLAILLSGFLTLVSLNCENLFDCHHDSLKNDTEWLPDGANHWSNTRYWRKLNNIGKEILACGEAGSDGGESDAAAWQLPDLVALCEVENDSVLVDLTRRSLLRNARYEYVMTDSPDPRGIDVALLYSPFSFRLLVHRSIRVEPLPDMHPTRDILYACGQLITGDTLHVFVVHAPSRAGGERFTRNHRLQVAKRLCQTVDSIRANAPEALVAVAGDFNDEGRAPSLRMLEKAGLNDVAKNAKGQHGAQASYRFQGQWTLLDHVFVSHALTGKWRNSAILDAPFLLEPDEEYGGVKPRRCYLGPRYLGGFSDHLPLVARFRFP